jgi:hypothetical protein
MIALSYYLSILSVEKPLCSGTSRGKVDAPGRAVRRGRRVFLYADSVEEYVLLHTHRTVMTVIGSLDDVPQAVCQRVERLLDVGRSPKRKG